MIKDDKDNRIISFVSPQVLIIFEKAKNLNHFKMTFILSKKTIIQAFILGASYLVIGSALFALHYSAYKMFMIYGGLFMSFAMILFLFNYLKGRN